MRLWAHFRGFCNVDLIHFYLYGICNLTKVGTRRIMLLDIFQTFSEQIFIRNLWTAAIIYTLSYFEKQSHAKKVFLKISQSSRKKHLFQSLFVNVAGLVYFCEFCKTFTWLPLYFKNFRASNIIYHLRN